MSVSRHLPKSDESSLFSFRIVRAHEDVTISVASSASGAELAVGGCAADIAWLRGCARSASAFAAA